MWYPFARLTQQWANKAEAGRHNVGRGLWLNVASDGAAAWELTLYHEGAQHDVVLGVFPEMTLRQARKSAKVWRGLARSGLDPAQQQEAFRNAAARNLHQFYC